MTGISIRVTLPPGWYRMPRGTKSSWIDEIVAAADRADVPELALRRSLEAAAAAATAQARPHRIHLMYLGDPPAAAVLAWASVDVFARGGGDAAWYAAQVRAAEPEAPDDPVAVWHREVEEREVGGAPAVMVHDLLTDAEPDGRVAHQRVLVALFPDTAGGAGRIVQVQLSTPNLALFDDVVAAGVALAEGVDIAAEDAA